MHVVAYNHTEGPIVVDDEGRTLGGGEWGAVDLVAGPITDARDRGELSIFDNLDDGPGQNPQALEALAAAREANKAGATEPGPAPEASSANPDDESETPKAARRARSKAEG